MNRNQYVMKLAGGWAVLNEGCSDPGILYHSKEEAAQQAEKVARRHHADLIIYDIDGTVRMRNR